MKKAQRRGYDYEKEQAQQHGGQHIGGPGNPDYVRGQKKAEVKNWTRPVDSGVVKKAAQDGIKEIASVSGFTKPAEILAKAKGITLIARGKRKV